MSTEAETAAETGLAADRFPVECPYTLDQLLAVTLPEADA